MSFWFRVRQSRVTILHQVRRLHFLSTQQSSLQVGSSIRVLPSDVVVVPDWRISRTPSQFCDNARFFAAPVQPKQKEDTDKGPRLNESITGDVVRVVLSENEHVIMPLREAFQRAQRLGMDLVEVNRRAEPPVCKIMDYHKEQYVKKLKVKELSKTKEKIKGVDSKEIRLTAKIEKKDLEMKAKNAIRSMESGYRVKCHVVGKESEDLGGTLARLCALLEDVAIVESGPKVDRRQAYIVVRHAKFGPPKSGVMKKISHISVDDFRNVEPAMAEDAINSEPETKQSLVYEHPDENKKTSLGPNVSDSRRPEQSPISPQPSVVIGDRYKKNPQTKPADGARTPVQPPNSNTGFPSVTRHGLQDTQNRNPRPSVKEIPRPSAKEILRQQQPIREPPKPATSFGIFSSVKTSFEDKRRPESDGRNPSTSLEKNPMPEKTFGIFSKR